METNKNIENYNHEAGHKRKFSNTLVLGIIVILAGALLLLRNMGVIERPLFRIIFSWEMLLIVIGVFSLLSHSKAWGGILILIGGIFLISRIYGFPMNFWQFALPSLIILVGLVMIFSSSKLISRQKVSISNFNNDLIEEVSIFAGSERSINSDSFRGGRILAVFGGSEIDLSEVTLSSGVNELEITCIFGGTSLKVPSDWNIKIEGFNIFGGYEMKRNPALVDLNKTLIIKGVCAFGGGEIKS